jgi:amino acid transporter
VSDPREHTGPTAPTVAANRCKREAMRPAYHPRSHARRERGAGLLGLREASAMAIGGMIGGGIFSVLGVTIDLAGHLAFAAFLVGGVIAALTAHAYARLALHAGRAGGPFTYLREEGHARPAAWVAWLLIVGYVFALAVYAFTFGHYLANVLGASALVARVSGVGVLALFVAINLRGVTTSGLTEDVVVFVKLAVLGGVALIGVAAFSPGRLAPLDNEGLLGVFLGAAVIFVAYEGFELLPYDYDDIANPRRTLPRALYLSVAIVVLVYVVVTLGAQMLLPDQTIIAEKEVAFAVVGKEALGSFGLWAATVGAVFSTSSAINATLFSTARLVRDVSAADELPTALGRERGGLPVAAVAWIAVFGAAFSLLPGITEIVSFGSLTFLLVFGLINLLHARHTAAAGWDRSLAYVGGAACFAAAGGLLYYLARWDWPGLALIGACTAAIAVARAGFVRSRQRVLQEAAR